MSDPVHADPAVSGKTLWELLERLRPFFWAIEKGESRTAFRVLLCDFDAFASTLHLAAPSPPSERIWQPIESAPKGQTCLIFSPEGIENVIVAKSRDGKSWWTRPGMYSIHPTHWMPLPAAPAEPEG